MSCIGFKREEDPELHDLVSRKILIPGWAGELSDEEAVYLANKLTGSSKLRQKWGVRLVFGKRWKRISPEMAKRLCAAWASNEFSAVKRTSTASGKKENTISDTDTSTRQLVLIS